MWQISNVGAFRVTKGEVDRDNKEPRAAPTISVNNSKTLVRARVLACEAIEK